MVTEVIIDLATAKLYAQFVIEKGTDKRKSCNIKLPSFVLKLPFAKKTRK